MINDLVKDVIAWNDSIQGEGSHQSPISPSTNFTKVPTLLKGYYEQMSPMLLERYKMFGTWLYAPHGNWLSLDEMEALWQDWDNEKQKNTYAAGLKMNTEVWDNDAIRLFRPERISVFAASLDTYTRIYLLWFDGFEEPELWLYDTSGEARFKNLSAYLEAILNNDSSAYSANWILGYNQ